jgi:hypothetical protein
MTNTRRREMGYQIAGEANYATKVGQALHGRVEKEWQELYSRPTI